MKLSTGWQSVLWCVTLLISPAMLNATSKKELIHDLYNKDVSVQARAVAQLKQIGPSMANDLMDLGKSSYDATPHLPDGRYAGAIVEEMGPSIIPVLTEEVRTNAHGNRSQAIIHLTNIGTSDSHTESVMLEVFRSGTDYDKQMAAIFLQRHGTAESKRSAREFVEKIRSKMSAQQNAASREFAGDIAAILFVIALVSALGVMIGWKSTRLVPNPSLQRALRSLVLAFFFSPSVLTGEGGILPCTAVVALFQIMNSQRTVAANRTWALTFLWALPVTCGWILCWGFWEAIAWYSRRMKDSPAGAQ